MSDTSTKPKLECKPDGPYVIRDLTRLRAASGADLPTKPVVALCRCGGSANKPFCDGTHQRNGFSGANQADPGSDRRATYAGKKIVIHDNRALCAHAGHCTDGLPGVFREDGTPWIDADGAPVEAIIAIIARCPSGALSYSIAGGEHRDLARDAAVDVTKDGPYAVTGGVELTGQAWGEGASREHFTLCRCGGSRNKPFCDGTHWSIGFKDG